MNYDIGYFDEEACRVEPLDTPFKAKLLHISSEQNVTYVSRTDKKKDGGR